MAFNAYSIYAVNVDTIGQTLFLDQITRQSHNFAPQLVKLLSDGAADPTFSSIGKYNAEVTFSSTKVATALGLGGLSGFVIDSDATNPGLELYLQAHQPGGTRKTGATHVKVTMGNGILVPQSLSAGATDPATLDFMAVGISDGVNDPATYAINQALPATTPAADQLFYAGPVTINGVKIEGVQSLEMDFGVDLNRIQTDGLPYDTFVNIAKREPVIKITTTDVDRVLNEIGPSGAGHTAACDYYLRKAANGGARVADATAEHIKLSTHKGSFVIREISGQSGEILACQIEVHPVWDGTNDVVTINTASAIA